MRLRAFKIFARTAGTVAPSISVYLHRKVEGNRIKRGQLSRLQTGFGVVNVVSASLLSQKQKYTKLSTRILGSLFRYLR
jgi:3-oxoacyl-[acyl-carrier-protein] synthase III